MGKDRWDILKIVSAASIPLIIGFATIVYNNVENARNNLQKERELSVLQVQTVQGFMGELKSNDECSKEAALLAIYSLGNPKLAVDLASSYRTRGSLFALARIAAISDSIFARKAVSPLFDALLDPDPLIRESAISAWLKISSPTINNIMCDLLKSADWEIRYSAARILGLKGGSNILPCLEEANKNEKEKMVKDELLKSINKLQERMSISSTGIVFYCPKSGCPGHSSPVDQCAYYCDKPGCPGHASPDDHCAYYCGKLNCPGHSSPKDRCN